VKKLLAIAIVGGFLALMTGCPAATTKVTSTGPAPTPTGPKDPVKDKDKDPLKDKDKDPLKDKDKDPLKDKDKDPLKDKDKVTKTQEGKFVKATDEMLTMTDKDGKGEMKHKINKDATITLDGKKAELKELSDGMTIEVTTDKDGNVTKIAATKK